MDFDHNEFKDLLKAIHDVYGYDFTDYAEASVKRRIDHFMSSRKIDTLGNLGRMILQNEDLFEEFIQEVSVTVTEMFRDPTFYKSLREHVIKRVF